MLFTGSHERTLDTKNRLQIPSDFRAEMGDEGTAEVLYIAPGPRNNTLSIYTRSGFESLVQRVSAETMDSPDALDFELYFSQVRRVEMDKQGRLVLPQELLATHDMGTELTLAGQVDHIDIWRTGEFRESIRTRFNPQWPMLQRHLRRGGRRAGGMAERDQGT